MKTSWSKKLRKQKCIMRKMQEKPQLWYWCDWHQLKYHSHLFLPV